MLDRGELRSHWAGRFRRVSGEALAEQLANDALASLILRAILAGELEAPKPRSPSDPPLSLIWALSRIPELYDRKPLAPDPIVDLLCLECRTDSDQSSSSRDA